MLFMDQKIKSILPIIVMIMAFIIAVYVAKIVYKYFTKNNLQELSRTQAQKFLNDKNKSSLLRRMSEYGYMYKHGYDVEVSTYIMEKIGCAFLFGIVSFMFFKNIPVSIILFAFGYFLVDISYKIQNNIDNNEMENDIRNLRDTMIIHAEAGIQIKDTLLTCINEAENKRFKQALNEFYNFLVTQKLTINEALKIFESRFSNEKITEICSIINQSIETGRSAEMLDSLVENAESEEEANNYKKEKKLDRRMLMIILVYFACILANVFYSIIISVMSSISGF